MNDGNLMTRMALLVVAVPVTILIFNLLGANLCDVWHHEAVQFLKGGNHIATVKLNAYWHTRHLFLFLGTLGGVIVSHAAYLLWQGKHKNK